MRTGRGWILAFVIALLGNGEVLGGPTAGDEVVLVSMSIDLPDDLRESARTRWYELLAALLRPALAAAMPEGTDASPELGAALSAAAEGKPTHLALVAGDEGVESSPPRLAIQDGGARVGQEEWPNHLALITPLRGPAASAAPVAGTVTLALNIDGLRRRYPPAFDDWQADGRAARLLRSVNLLNARMIGLHARIIDPAHVAVRDLSLPRRDAAEERYAGPPLVVLDATWSARSEPPGKVHTAPLTIRYWPASQFGAPPATDEAAAVMAMRLIWRPALERGLDAYSAMLTAGAARQFAADRAVWARREKPSIDRLISTIDPWIWLGISAERRAEVMIHARTRDEAALGPTMAAAGDVVPPPPLVEADINEQRSVWSASPAAGWWVRRAHWSVDGVSGRAGIMVRIGLQDGP